MIGHNSQIIKDEDVQGVVDFLRDYPDLIADAKKQAERSEWLAEVLLAELVVKETGKSHAERESKAMVNTVYKNAKEDEINARREETYVKAKFAANELIASLYQTQSANLRSTKI